MTSPAATSGSSQGWAARFARRLTVALSTVVLGTVSTGCGDAAVPISVMTRNLYLGADLTPLFSATTVDDLASLSGGVWRQVLDSRFEERAAVLAAEIVRVDPDVVSLQEVSLYRTQTPSDWRTGTPPNASQVTLDFLDVLLRALEARNARYLTADVGEATDAELPALGPDGATFDVRLTDRNVILVRGGMSFASGPRGIFAAEVPAPVGGAGGAMITLRRGFVSDDVTIGGRTVRVVDSHLEVSGTLGRIQEEQGRELVEALKPYEGAMILAGDFNSRADETGTMTYHLLKAGGFKDAWTFRNRNSGASMSATGDTCCLDLSDPSPPEPRERIDLVLFRGSVDPVDAAVVETVTTPSHLWPSDHLGVSAKLQLR